MSGEDRGGRWSWLRDLGRWPLLLAAIASIAAALSFGIAAQDTPEARGFLLALGAVLMGAWIALLAAAHHTGEARRRQGTPPEDDASQR